MNAQEIYTALVEEEFGES